MSPRKKAPPAAPAVPAGPRRAALYLRVSTEGQADGFGLDAQRAKLHMLAAVEGWQVVTEFVDAGVSGRKAQRPGLDALLAAVEAREIDVVMIGALDRLGRSTRIVLDLVERITSTGAELYSAREKLDTSTPTGRFILTVFAALAELDRANIVQRTSEGREERAKVDGDKGGRMPYGYSRTDEGPAIVAERAAVVRRIFAERVEGRTLRQIAEGLNADGVRPPGLAARWYASSVAEVLKNAEAYGGGPRNDSPAHWPIILEVA